jgi:hypothetical protein
MSETQKADAVVSDLSVLLSFQQLADGPAVVGQPARHGRGGFTMNQSR